MISKYKDFCKPFQQHGADEVQHKSCNQLPEFTCLFCTRVALIHNNLYQITHLHSYKQIIYKSYMKLIINSRSISFHRPPQHAERRCRPHSALRRCVTPKYHVAVLTNKTLTYNDDCGFLNSEPHLFLPVLILTHFNALPSHCILCLCDQHNKQR